MSFPARRMAFIPVAPNHGTIIVNRNDYNFIAFLQRNLCDQWRCQHWCAYDRKGAPCASLGARAELRSAGECGPIAALVDSVRADHDAAPPKAWPPALRRAVVLDACAELHARFAEPT